MNAPGEIAPLARARAAARGDRHHGGGGASRGLRRPAGIAREKAAIFTGLEPGGAAILPRDIETYPILLAAARRAGARPVRFGATGRPEFALLETTVDAGRHLRAGPRARRALPLQARGAGPASRDERARRARGGRGGRRRHRPRRAGAGALARARGPRRALARPDRARRARRRGHADRRELQRQPRGDGGGVRGAGRDPARGRRRPDRARPAGGLSRRHARARAAGAARCTRASPRRPASPRSRPCTAPARGCARCTRRCPTAQRGEWFPDAAAMAARAGRLLDAGDVALVKGSNGSRVSLVVDAIKKMGEARPPELLEG